MDNGLQAAIAGIANGVAQVAGQAIATQEDKHAQRRAFDYNMQMAKYQNEVNLENWTRQNEYNSPSAQMERLKAAGLNPNLVYGGGSAQTAASAIHAMPGATMQAYQGNWRVADALSSALDGAFKAMAIKKQAQEVKNLGESQRVTRLDGDMRELQIIGQRYANSKTKEEAAVWREMYDQKIINMRAEGQLTDARRFDLDSQRAFRDGPQTAYTTQQTASSIAEMGLVQYRKDLMIAQAANALASAGVAAKTADRIVQEIVNLQADLALKKETLTGKQIENKISDVLLKNGVNLRSGSEVNTLINLVYGLFETGKRVARGEW